MSYQVDKFNGTFLTAVEDGTIDTTTDIRLVGKNYAGYGEVQNENFIHMLEHFANTTAPPRAVVGQIWYDSTSTEKKLKFYDGSKWKIANGAEVSGTAPSGLSTGEFWWDNSAKQLYAWSGTEYVLVGPETSPELGASGLSTRVVKDNGNADQTIITLTSGDVVVAIISSEEFTLTSDPGLYPDLANFRGSSIQKGITIANTNSSGISTNDYKFWGTAESAKGLVVDGAFVDSANFIQDGAIDFEDPISFAEAGFRVGVTNPDDLLGNLRIFIETYSVGPTDTRQRAVVESIKNEDVIFRFSDPLADTSVQLLELNSNKILPGINDLFDIGSDDPSNPSNNRYFRNIYSSKFIGTHQGPVVGNVTGVLIGNVTDESGDIIVNPGANAIGNSTTRYSGTLTGNVVGELQGDATNATRLGNNLPAETVPTSSDKRSVPTRDINGNIYASQFIGIADKSDRLKIDDTATDSDPEYRSAKTITLANTIVARDGSADVYANIFHGTATAARYADLAEKYLADKDYEPGTVVMIGGDAEVTACTQNSHVIGVVSTNPAYMMNSELEGGTYIALKGRVPVKVGGKVKKGDTLVAGVNGYAVAGNQGHVFAVALQASENEAVKLIEAVVL